jgi:hypothetical protein
MPREADHERTRPDLLFTMRFARADLQLVPITPAVFDRATLIPGRTQL